MAREAPGIRLTHDGATMQQRQTKPMKQWQDLTHYASLRLGNLTGYVGWFIWLSRVLNPQFSSHSGQYSFCDNSVADCEQFLGLIFITHFIIRSFVDA